ncbi:MAG: circadian clock KaiB family protein [Geitlerinemataceae cyanobacterium]
MSERPHHASSFKGIALCTPGGDVAYTIDRSRTQHWHAQLCEALGQALGLSEAPYFLMPHGSATVDYIVDASGERWFAEAGPIALRYRALLDTLFDMGEGLWHPLAADALELPIAPDYCERFPQLWEANDLIVSVTPSPAVSDRPPQTGYVLELFVRSDNAEMASLLRRFHSLLERALDEPYSLKVIDVIAFPELAESRKIMATPTLLRISPQPTRRLVGMLDSPERLRALLTY